MAHKYPQNFIEGIINAIPNCTTMVIGMVSLNLGIFGALNWGHFWHAAMLIWPVAFVLDFFIVGPITMRICRRYNNMKIMPFIRVGMMAGILTFAAPIIEAGFIPTCMMYLIALPRNYIVALLLQILVARNVGMWVLDQYRHIISDK